jgi:hypothetical protein
MQQSEGVSLPAVLLINIYLVITQPYTTLQYHSTRQKVSDYFKLPPGLLSSRIVNKNFAYNILWCRQSFIDGSGDKATKTLLATCLGAGRVLLMVLEIRQ